MLAGSCELKRHFGRAEFASPNAGFRIWSRKARRCWISTKPTRGHWKGWGRLIHDVSHTVFRYRHPSFRPHDGGHAKLELEMAQYVVAQGWLGGTLKPVEKPKPTVAEKRASRLAQVEVRIERWESKLRRAETALRKLRRQRSAALRVQLEISG